MANFTVTHEINCDADTFWRVFFDRTFNEELYKKGLQFPEFSILEQRDTEREIYRKCAGMPNSELPGPLKKMFGGGFRYTEEGTFNKTAKVWTWKMTPGTMADKIKNGGVMRADPAGEGKVRRVAEITNEAKVFGIGGMMESFAEKELRKGWEESAKFLNQWIKDGKGAVAAP